MDAGNISNEPLTLCASDLAYTHVPVSLPRATHPQYIAKIPHFPGWQRRGAAVSDVDGQREDGKNLPVISTAITNNFPFS